MEENNNVSKKFKKVKINTPQGVRYLTFKPIILSESPDSEELTLVCKHCSYLGKCDKIINPQEIDDPNSKFQEFCSELGIDGDNDDVSLKDYIPVEGTLEENLGDFIRNNKDAYQVLIAKGGYIKLTDVIDSICKESCPLWNEGHTECKSSNEFCMLEDLMKKKNE